MQEKTFRKIYTDTPISKVGVFPYYGYQIDQDGQAGLDPYGVYGVFRPPEVLRDPATIESFKLLSLQEGHDFSEDTPIEGVTGEDVYYDENDRMLKANVKILKENIYDSIKKGKKELSVAYDSEYNIGSGIFEGQPYVATLTKMNGLHLALVSEGRCGSDVALPIGDSKEKLIYDSLDIGDKIVSEENTQEEVSSDPKLSELMELKKAFIDAVQSLGGTAEKLLSMIQSQASPDDVVDQDAPTPEDDANAAASDEDPDQDQGKPAMADEDPDQDQDKPAMADEDPPVAKPPLADAALKRELSTLKKEIGALKAGGYKAFMREASQKSKLADELSYHIGSFDHSEMTLKDVATYGLSKLGVKSPAGQETSILGAFLAGKKSAQPRAPFADSKLSEKSSYLKNYLTRGQ